MPHPGFKRWVSGPAGPVRKKVMEGIGLANVVGAVVSFITGNSIDTDAGGSIQADSADILVFVAYLAVMLPIGAWLSARIVDRGTIFYDERRAPTTEEAPVALTVPWREAVESFTYWAGAAVVFGLLNFFVYTNSAAFALKAMAMILLGGLTTSAVVFLLVERAMRPVFSAVLAHGPAPAKLTLGVRPRLLITWTVVSVVPLLLIGVGVLGDPDRDVGNILVGIWLFIIAAIGVGIVVTRANARSVADPLDQIRAAMERVADDDLDVEVTVDDGGEVGRLQSGFNRMVAGLRERRLLEDLFGRHVGAEAAKYALEEGTRLGGERREASVVFVDVIRSTALAQTRSAEDVVTILNAFFEAVVKRIAAEGGWVNKFEGDGALCVFGAPMDQDDHAERALRAARLLRRDLLALAITHEGLDAAIGVSSGDLVAGNVGAESRFEYTVIGDPVNEASRLTDEAKHRLGRVLASEEAIERAGAEASQWSASGELALRGRVGTTFAYEPASADA